MATFDPSRFAVTPSTTYDPAQLWGGGWEPGACPFDKGWRARWSGQVLVIGRKGVAGAFTAMAMSGDRWDVAFYEEEKPEDLARRITANENLGALDPAYTQVGGHWGWGNNVLEWARPMGLKD